MKIEFEILDCKWRTKKHLAKGGIYKVKVWGE